MARGEQLYSIRLWGEVGLDPALGPLSKRARALLARLALAPGSGLARHAAAALLWPDRSDAQALANLRQLLHDHAWLSRGESPLLLVSRDRLSLDCALLATDDDALIAAAAVPLSLADAVARTEPVFLGGLDDVGDEFDAWRATEQRRATERLAAAIHEAAARALNAGDAVAAARLADAWQRFDPCDEVMVRRGFAADAALGNVGAIKRRLAAVTAALAELDAGPSGETRAAAAAALAPLREADAAAIPVAAPSQPQRPAPRRWLAIGAAVLVATGLFWAAWSQLRPAVPAVPAAETARAAALTASARQMLALRTRGGYARDAELARAAIAHDPGYAPAYAELAIAVWMPAWWAEQEATGARARIKREALDYLNRALALSPGLPRALAAKGLIIGGDAGRRLLEAAVASNPADADIWLWTADARADVPDFAGALAAHARSIEIAPDQLRIVGFYVAYAQENGRDDLADAAIANFERSATDQYAVRLLTANGLTRKGRFSEASAAQLWLLENGPIDRLLHTRNLIYIGRTTGDRAAIRRLAEAHPQLSKTYAHLYDPAGAEQRWRGHEKDFMASVFADEEARSLMAAGKARVLLAFYDARDRSSAPPTGCCDPASVASSLIPALRSAGRAAEAEAMLAALTTELEHWAHGGVPEYNVAMDRFMLGCLHHDPKAPAGLESAIDHNWRAQDNDFAVDPADEPACKWLVGTPAFEATRGRLLRLLAADRPTILANMEAARRFLQKNPPVTAPADVS